MMRSFIIQVASKVLKCSWPLATKRLLAAGVGIAKCGSDPREFITGLWQAQHTPNQNPYPAEFTEAFTCRISASTLDRLATVLEVKLVGWALLACSQQKMASSLHGTPELSASTQCHQGCLCVFPI